MIQPHGNDIEMNLDIAQITIIEPLRISAAFLHITHFPSEFPYILLKSRILSPYGFLLYFSTTHIFLQNCLSYCANHDYSAHAHFCCISPHHTFSFRIASHVPNHDYSAHTQLFPCAANAPYILTCNNMGGMQD